MDYKHYSYLEDLYAIIQHQQDIIAKYEEYIETNIHQKIKKVAKEDFDVRALGRVYCQRITIPQTDIMMACDPKVIAEWEEIKLRYPHYPLPDIKRFIMEKSCKKA